MCVAFFQLWHWDRFCRSTSVFSYQGHPTHPCPLLDHSRITDVTQSLLACCIILEACNRILHSATSCVLPESLHILPEVQHVTTAHHWQ